MSNVVVILGCFVAVLIFWSFAAFSIMRARRWSARMVREVELHAPLLCVLVLMGS